MSSENGLVLVVDFGAQYAQLIARRVREAHVYSEIVPHTMSAADMLAKRPAAIILSGGPASVYADGAPSFDPEVFDAGVPVLGICYGFQTMAAALGEVQALLDRPDELERSARSVVERLALLLQASLLVRHAPPEVADAFVESRLGPGGGLAFGTLSPAADAEAIVRRALPLAT